MNTLKARSRGEIGIRLAASQSLDARIRKLQALDKSNPLKLRQSRKLHDRIVCQVSATGQVNVADTVAFLYQPEDAFVGDVAAVAEM